MASPREYYQDRIGYFSQKLAGLKLKIRLVAWLRLFIFAGFGLSVYWLSSQYTYSSGIFSAILLFGFFMLVRISTSLEFQRSLNRQLLAVNTNEWNVFHGISSSFDDGTAYCSNAGYLEDLDIFGNFSVFHLLNRCSTSHGKERLARQLSNPIISKEVVDEYQQAIISLSGQAEKRQLIAASGLMHEEKEGSLDTVGEWLRSPVQMIHRTWLKLFRWLLPAYTLVALFYYLSTNNYLPFIIGVVLSWIIIFVFAQYISHQHLLISKKQRVLDQYSAILGNFSECDTGNSLRLIELKQVALKAGKSIKKLSSLSQLFDQRLNMLVTLLLNSLFLYDIQCMFSLERWKENNNTQFEGWIQCVGDIEYINSLAGFAYNNPDYTYPTVQTGKLFIEASQLAHPLIASSERVANDFNIGTSNKLHLITGSNMSGKTTFLRTVAVNLLLAQCGAPVCATAFHFSPMKLLTSIRINDSLEEHTSYFMAELKRLQEIILQLQAGERAIVFIDEILRGTNSEDKTHGSEQFIHKLLQFDCLALFATHDLALSKLEVSFPGEIRNYCFESAIVKEELLFDYKLQTGIAKNKNASFLMKKMQII
jgi:MutS domain V